MAITFFIELTWMKSRNILSMGDTDGEVRWLKAQLHTNKALTVYSFNSIAQLNIALDKKSITRTLSCRLEM